jgi:hypothetical protein
VVVGYCGCSVVIVVIVIVLAFIVVACSCYYFLFVVVGVRGLIIYLFVCLVVFCHLMNCFVWIGF